MVRGTVRLWPLPTDSLRWEPCCHTPQPIGPHRESITAVPSRPVPGSVRYDRVQPAHRALGRVVTARQKPGDIRVTRPPQCVN